MEEYEWGIEMYRMPWETEGPHRTGMTEEQARNWIAQWESDGGMVGAFTLIRRPLPAWERVS